MKENSYYKHIDNGGIHFNLKEEEFGGVKLETYAQYFGYPAVASSLGGLNKEDLLKIGQLFISFAMNMENNHGRED